MIDPWLSVDQIAEYLGVSRDTIYAWLNHKQMPGHRVGHLWKFKRAEVDSWVRGGGASNPKSRSKADCQGSSDPNPRPTVDTQAKEEAHVGRS